MADKGIKVVNPITKKRNELYTAMNPATRQVASEIEDRLGRQNTTSVIISHDIGTLIVNVLEDEGQYGSDAVVQIANYLNIDGRETLFYRLAGFARTFDRAYVEAQSKRALANGQPLRLGHWCALSQLKSVKDREEAIKRVREQSLSVNELELQIRATANGKKKNVRKGGRLPQIPTSPAGALQKLIGLGLQLTNYEAAFEENVFSLLEELTPDRITPGLHEKLDEAIDQLVTLGERSAELVGGLVKGRKRLASVLKAKQAGEAKAADDDEPEAKPAKPAKPKKPAAAAAPAPAPAPAAKPTKADKDKKKKKSRRPAPSTL